MRRRKPPRTAVGDLGTRAVMLHSSNQMPTAPGPAKQGVIGTALSFYCCFSPPNACCWLQKNTSCSFRTIEYWYPAGQLSKSLSIEPDLHCSHTRHPCRRGAASAISRVLKDDQ